MQKTTKILSIAVAMFAIAGMIGFSAQAFAYQKPPGAERLFQFSLHGAPVGFKDTQGKCSDNNSNNIFTTRGSSNQNILFINTTSSSVVDHCTQSIDGDRAELDLDVDTLPAGTVYYTVQMLGKPGGQLKFCSQTFSDFEADYCVIDTDPTETFNRATGKPTLSVPKQLFADNLENQIWTMNTNGDFRLAKIAVWVIPSP